MSDGAAMLGDVLVAMPSPGAAALPARRPRGTLSGMAGGARESAAGRIRRHHLADGCSLALPVRAHGAEADGFAVVLGGGKGCLLKCDATLAGVFVPLRGRMQFHGSRSDYGALAAGEFRVSEGEAAVHASGRGNALWIAVLGGRAAWRDLLARFEDPPLGEPGLLPAVHEADRDLRRCAAAVARTLTDDALGALLDRVVTLQSGLAEAIARCPGRTYAQKRAVFLRLQRVRNYIAANCHLDVDNEALARMASYSPWHFIRAFRSAYRQTPHAYLVDERLRRARRLLRSSPLAIAEVALASGFENRCAFSRLFRQRFGTTAGAVRRAC